MSEEFRIASESGVGCIEGDLASTDGYSILRTLIWFPPARVTIRGVVQIIHGMSEHMERYEEFATALASKGYVVGGEDHSGHGKSACSDSQLGHLPMDSGDEVLVSDARNFGLLLRGAFPTVPFFVMGHSMGSFIARILAEKYSEGITGVILCGTGNQPVALSKAGHALTKLIARRNGPTHRSDLVDQIVMGTLSKGVKNARTDTDWICCDPEVVDAYIADPLCGQKFSLGGYAALTNLTAACCSKRHAKKVPTELPLLFIGGEQDPVGNCGKGVKSAAQMYKKAGVRDVETILYPGMRHEILNEPGRAKVYLDVLNWIEDHR